jgi:hypothetical protein
MTVADGDGECLSWRNARYNRSIAPKPRFQLAKPDQRQQREYQRNGRRRPGSETAGDAEAGADEADAPS